MLKRVVLSLLLIAFIPVPFQARLQENAQPAGLRIMVEGDPSASRAIIEAMRRSSASSDFKFQFVSKPVDQHDIRLIVAAEKGSVRCTDPANTTTFASFFYSSVVAIAPDGRMLFVAAQSGYTPKQTIDAIATDVMRNLYAHTIALKEKQQPGSNAGRNQELAEAGKTLIQGLPAEPGIYHKDNTGWIRLREGFATGVKTKGMGKAMLTWGLSEMRVAQIYSGAQSSVQLSERKPIFYVRGYAVSERDVQIMRLEKKKDHRQIQIASIAAFNPKPGYRQRDIYDAAIARIAEDVYKIMPASELEPGEYVLSLSKAGFEGVYEFGITSMKK
jgi:hypothetical protein